MDLKKTAVVLIDLQKESKYGIGEVEEIVAHTRHITREDAIALSYKEPLKEEGKPVYDCTGREDIEEFDGFSRGIPKSIGSCPDGASMLVNWKP